MTPAAATTASAVAVAPEMSVRPNVPHAHGILRIPESVEYGSAGAESGAENEWGRLENPTGAIDMDCGLDTELSSLPGLKRSPMPGKRISKARHSGTKQAVRVFCLTNRMLATKGHTDEGDQCPSGDGFGPAEADATARQCHWIASLDREQRKVHELI